VYRYSGPGTNPLGIVQWVGCRRLPWRSRNGRLAERCPSTDPSWEKFDHEWQTTRKLISRLPDDKLGFKPHATSMSAGELASHIAEMYSWGAPTLNLDELDLAPPRRSEMGAVATDDPAWMATWKLKMGGQAMMSMPRVACMRGMLMNHIVHHRGQLSVTCGCWGSRCRRSTGLRRTRSRLELVTKGTGSAASYGDVELV
jgi:hypothetical protein